jgi:hypothetical protein
MVLMLPGSDRYEAGALPDEKLIAAMMKYNEELAKAGVLLALDGLHPSSKGARIRFSGGKRTVTDGPFAEAREVIGGYWRSFPRRPSPWNSRTISAPTAARRSRTPGAGSPSGPLPAMRSKRPADT